MRALIQMEIVIPDWDTDELSREDLLDVLKDTLEAEDVIVKAIEGHIYPPAVKTAGLPEI